MTSTTNPLLNLSFTYDELNRLLNVSGGQNQTLAYNAIAVGWAYFAYGLAVSSYDKFLQNGKLKYNDFLRDKDGNIIMYADIDTGVLSDAMVIDCAAAHTTPTVSLMEKLKTSIGEGVFKAYIK